MKIRKKNTTEACYELAEESPRFFLGHYLSAHPSQPPVALPKSEYELVPEEAWDNVTDYAQLQDNPMTGTNEVRVDGEQVAIAMRSYRFVKKSLWECFPSGLRQDLELYQANGPTLAVPAINSLKRTYVLYVQQQLEGGMR